ncbi:MAG: hypothetical protein RLZZ613_1846 [Pseudomonadota bacterium]
MARSSALARASNALMAGSMCSAFDQRVINMWGRVEQWIIHGRRLEGEESIWLSKLDVYNVLKE